MEAILFESESDKTQNEESNSKPASVPVKRRYKPRKFLDITPLHIENELKEIENEPLPEYTHTEEVDWSAEDPENHLKVAAKHETGNAESDNTKNESKTKSQDSFSLDFQPLNIDSPSPVLNEVPKITTCLKLNTKPVGQRTVASTPKVQYSINVGSHLKSSSSSLSTKKSELFKTPSRNPMLSSVSAKARLLSNQKENIKNQHLGQNKVLLNKKDNLSKNLLVRQANNINSLTNQFIGANPEFKTITVKGNNYIILNWLGRGGSSEVYHCYDVVSKCNRAIKCVSLHNPQTATGYVNEVKALVRLQDCDRIIKMFDYEIKSSEKTLLVVLEMGGSDLARILRELSLNATHVPVYKLLFYWMEMLYAVKQIHEKGIIHADLKPANFLSGENCLKLIDFGIAACISNDMTSIYKSTTEGSCNYISPEAINIDPNVKSPNSNKPKYRISYKSDVWSLGCILYQLVYRRTPFHKIENMWQKLMTISNPKHEIDFPEADWVPRKVLETIRRCLQHEMKSRPTVEELIFEYEEMFNSL